MVARELEHTLYLIENTKRSGHCIDSKLSLLTARNSGVSMQEIKEAFWEQVEGPLLALTWEPKFPIIAWVGPIIG